MRTSNWVRAQYLPLRILLAVSGCNHSNSSANSSDANSAQAGASAQSPSSSTSPSSDAQTQAPPPVVIPAGKILVVTLDQNVSTKTNSSGDQFVASLASQSG